MNGNQTRTLSSVRVPQLPDVDKLALQKAEEKLEGKLKRSYIAASKAAFKALRSRDIPESPVILFGSEGFSFGDDDGVELAVTVDLYEEFENNDKSQTPETLVPEWYEIYQNLSSMFKTGDEWAAALGLVEETGDFSALIW